MKTLARIKQNPRIADAWSEVADGNGYWAVTKPGFYFPNMECHTCREDTLATLLKEVRTIAPCTCADCLAHSEQFVSVARTTPLDGASHV